MSNCTQPQAHPERCDCVTEGRRGHPNFAPTSDIDLTLAERGSRYGDFTDHARICQRIIGTMQDFKKQGVDVFSGIVPTSTPWENLSDVQKQALTVIADKIARILSGDPNYADNWHDIQGYAKLAEDRLPRGGSSNGR